MIALIRSSLAFYWRTNLAVILGVAIAGGPTVRVGVPKNKMRKKKAPNGEKRPFY